MITQATQTIPPDAIAIYYDGGHGRKGTYYIWKQYQKVGLYSEVRWHWAALGNQGVEDNAPDAVDAAKRWIRGEKDSQ
jgi:hypothetical protein